MTGGRSEKPLLDDQAWANWDSPVILRRGGSDRKTAIANPAEALAFLTVAWRGEKCSLHQSARLACSQALRRRIPSEDARSAFIGFVEQANLLEEQPRPSGNGTNGQRLDDG